MTPITFREAKGNTPMTDFTPSDGCVFLGPARLSEKSVNDLLDIFEREDCPTLFNALYEAGQAAGFIPRVVPFRRVA